MSDQLPKGYVCTCGRRHRFPPYVYAHWTSRLVHTCDCGKDWELRNGRVRRGAVLAKVFYTKEAQA